MINLYTKIVLLPFCTLYVLQIHTPGDSVTRQSMAIDVKNLGKTVYRSKVIDIRQPTK